MNDELVSKYFPSTSTTNSTQTHFRKRCHKFCYHSLLKLLIKKVYIYVPMAGDGMCDKVQSLLPHSSPVWLRINQFNGQNYD